MKTYKNNKQYRDRKIAKAIYTAIMSIYIIAASAIISIGGIVLISAIDHGFNLNFDIYSFLIALLPTYFVGMCLGALGLYGWKALVYKVLCMRKK